MPESLRARETVEPAIAYAKVWAKLPRSRFVRYRRAAVPILLPRTPLGVYTTVNESPVLSGLFTSGR